MLLAIDTATRSLGLALHDGTTLFADQNTHIGNHHTTALAPAVDALLHASDLTPADLSALAVCTGPGSYTGLRIGVALAKGLAAVNHLPLVGVTSLDALAAGQPQYETGHALIAVVQAGRGRIIVQSYRWRKGRWHTRAEPRLLTWEDLLATIDGPAYLSGEINAAGHEALAEAQKTGLPVKIAPPAQRLRRAGFLAEVAWERLRTTDDRDQFAAARLAPIYLKTESTP